MLENGNQKVSYAKERVRHSEHANLRILELDFSHVSPQETLEMLDEYKKIVEGCAPNSVRLLVNVTEMTYDPSVSSKWKAMWLQYDPLIRASAIHGASSFLGIPPVPG